MNNLSINEKVEIAAKWIADCNHLVVFTGAGISTESGLPDYRGPNGVWTRRDKGLPPPRMEKSWDEVEPNAAHYAIVELQKIGKLKFLISQNIDNLHLKSGIQYECIAELHGNRNINRCINCNKLFIKKIGDWKNNYDKKYCALPKMPNQPICPYCGGSIVSSIVNFGDPLPEKDLNNSILHSKKCDVFLIIGSSLVVYPAARLPAFALENNAKVILLNKGETPYDNYVHLKIEGNAGEIVPKIVNRIKELLNLKVI
ncbi:MAG: SIR2 family NAD-dependent protein deacylase [Candidatus Helarchaeota archaeon]